MKSVFVLFLSIISYGCALIPFSDDESDRANDAQAEHGQRVQTALRSGDVVLGMSMRDVYGSWGEPRLTEQAGVGHQRWIYPEGPMRGLGASRVVYFENGRVVGWETVDSHR